MKTILSRKLIVTVATVALIALNKKLGLNLGTESIMAIAASVAAYCVGQGWADSKETKE